MAGRPSRRTRSGSRRSTRSSRIWASRVLKQWAVLGPYDFVNLVEAPNNEAIFKLSTELGSRGTIEITSMPAITIDELIKTLKP